MSTSHLNTIFKGIGLYLSNSPLRPISAGELILAPLSQLDKVNLLETVVVTSSGCYHHCHVRLSPVLTSEEVTRAAVHWSVSKIQQFTHQPHTTPHNKALLQIKPCHCC